MLRTTACSRARRIDGQVKREGGVSNSASVLSGFNQLPRALSLRSGLLPNRREPMDVLIQARDECRSGYYDRPYMLTSDQLRRILITIEEMIAKSGRLDNPKRRRELIWELREIVDNAKPLDEEPYAVPSTMLLDEEEPCLSGQEQLRRKSGGIYGLP